MSQSRDGANATEVVVQEVATIPPVINARAAGSSYNPFSESRPPSIHDAASSDESSSNEDEGEMSKARRRRKEEMKEKIEKKARKLMKQRIKKEKEKHPFFGMHQVPHNYEQQMYSSSQFQSIHLGRAPYFDGTDYPKWAFDMKMHLYGLHPSIWEVVCVGVIPSVNGVPTAEQAQEYFVSKNSTRSAMLRLPRRFGTH